VLILSLPPAVDVYCDYEAGAQDKKGAATKDAAATGKRDVEVEAQLTRQSQEEMLLTPLLTAVILLLPCAS